MLNFVTFDFIEEGHSIILEWFYVTSPTVNRKRHY